MDQTVRTLQIITGAMVMGVILFAVVAIVVTGGPNIPSSGIILSTVAAAWAVVAFLLHLVVPSIIASQRVRAVGADQLHSVYFTKTIIGLALLEGAAFFNLIALMLEHNTWSLAITGGLLFWMLGMFPTRTRVDQWVETKLMERSAG